MGLKPPLIYMSEQPADAQQRIGATTSMLVEAALTLVEGHDVRLLGRNLSHATSLHNTCVEYYQRLYTVMHDRRPLIVNRKPRKVEYEGPNLMLVSESPTSRFDLESRTRDFVTFDDVHWHERALQRMQDPQSRIRFLRWDREGWLAFDLEGTYIAMLTHRSGEKLLAEYRNHILIANV